MKIIVPPIVRALSLTDYAPELAAANLTLQVWVNPTREMLAEFESLKARRNEAQARVRAVTPETDTAPLIDELSAIGDGFAGWYARIWSQHSDAETHWTLEDVNAVVNNDANPGLYRWLTGQTWQMIREYRAAEKKS